MATGSGPGMRLESGLVCETRLHAETKNVGVLHSEYIATYAHSVQSITRS